MDLGISDKVAIVAASSRGLGKQAALALASEGAKLALCARTEEPLRETAGEIRKRYGVDVYSMPVDVTVRDDIEGFVEAVIDRFGAVHILVVNAGGPPGGSCQEHEPERWRNAFDLNFMSAVHFCRSVIPVMVKQRWGRLVFMTSIAVKQPIDGLVLSNAVRAGVTGLAKTLANELGPYNVLVNTVCPGYFLTDRVRNLADVLGRKKDITAQQIIDAWAEGNPVRRIGDPQEFGPLVAFLCSERASYITGSTVAIDGGYCGSLL
jgi:3-oxoacyl-[acyl-carrier protein] reductase